MKSHFTKVSRDKSTYKVSADIAFVKYWGKKDEVLRLPENSSFSMILEGLDTTTTVEFDEKLKKDKITIEGKTGGKEAERLIPHLDRIRKLAGKKIFARVESKNSFPKSTGLSSSGSGFAALTFAACKAIGLNLSEKELSILSRQGSGTACRCACSGYVQWLDGNTSNTSYSKTIFPKSHWDLRDLVVIVDEGEKGISSTEGHELAQSSVFYKTRQKHIKQKLNKVKKAVADKDFSKLGGLIEAEALEFHSILLTGQPPIVMWYPGTLEVIHEVIRMRSEGIEAYYTINTGFNLHVITLPKFENKVKKRLEALKLVQKTIPCKVGDGPKELKKHLF